MRSMRSSRTSLYDATGEPFACTPLIPHFGILGDGFNHRFFSAADIRGQGTEYYMAILRRALAEDVLARDTSVRIEDVNRLNRNAGKELAFKRRTEQIQDMALDQVKEMLDEAEGLARLAEDECDAMREELRQSRRANHDLEARIAWLEHALDSQGGSAAGDGAAHGDRRCLRAHYLGHRQTVRFGISRSNRFQRARMGIVGGLQVRTQGNLERLA